MSGIALLLISDGRDDYEQQARNSIQANVSPLDVNHVVHVDDADHTRGFSGAIQEGWERILDMDAEWVFHLELDFTLNESVELWGMVALLQRHPYLAQVSLKRQPVNEAEKLMGGIVECHPTDFEERNDYLATWTEHRRYWTTNPSVYSTRLCRMGWPQEQFSEGVFTHRLLADPLLRFAIWGGKSDPPRVTHIGAVRAGAGY